jgi:hypothetical protein
MNNMHLLQPSISFLGMYPKEADTQPGAVVHACNPTTREVEAGES